MLLVDYDLFFFYYLLLVPTTKLSENLPVCIIYLYFFVSVLFVSLCNHSVYLSVFMHVLSTF